MRLELEKRIRKQRADLDGIERDIAELESRKRTCTAVLNELETLLRLLPKTAAGKVLAEKKLRVDTDPFRAREVLRRNRGPLHVKDLLERIGGETGRNRRSSLASQLGAYAKRGEIFTKEGPNLFGLANYGPEAARLDDEKAFFAADMSEELQPREDDWQDDPEIPF